MPVPKRKTGKTKRNMRRSHHALTAPNLSECPNCGEKMLRHRICAKCGHYTAKKWARTVVNTDED